MTPDAIDTSILSRIGKTPLIELTHAVPKECARILLKIEAENPTGSMKDRMALAMIEAAEKDGRLKPGGPVVEYTGGSTGVSLAMICAVKGYPLSIVTSDAFSLEKRTHMAAFGAELTIVQSKDGGMDEALTRNMVETARRITAKTGAFWTDQLKNADQLAAYHRMGEEIWTQHQPGILAVAVEPSESAVLSGGPGGSHKIEGVGAGFVVPLWVPAVIDRIEAVSTEDAMAQTRALARLEGIFAGTSTGANLVAAIAVGRELGPDATVVTVMCDSGVKYLSTALYTKATG